LSYLQLPEHQKVGGRSAMTMSLHGYGANICGMCVFVSCMVEEESIGRC